MQIEDPHREHLVARESPAEEPLPLSDVMLEALKTMKAAQKAQFEKTNQWRKLEG